MSKKKTVAVAIRSRVIIGYHEEPEIVETFVEDQNRTVSDSYGIAHVAYDYPYKKIKRIDDYAELHLVQLGFQFIPVGLYETCLEMQRDATYDLKYAKNILLRILECDDLTGGESSCMEKTVLTLEKMIFAVENSVDNTEALDEMKELDRRVQELINDIEE